jgi:hypothetical protein
VNNIFIEKKQGKTPHDKIDSVKMDVRDICCDVVDWIELAQCMSQWCAFVINPQAP